MSPTADPPTETLRRFVYHVDQLQARRIIREEDLRSSLNINFAKGGPLTVRHHEPDEEDLRSYLLDFRKLVSDREPVFVYRVFKVAHRHVSSDEIVAGLARARAAWRDALQQGDIRFVVNDIDLTPETIMDLWINGWYFHDDVEKRRKLEALGDVPASRWLFIDSVVSATKVVLYVGHVLKIALREGLVSDSAVR
jgi:hypothetical protein